MIEPTRNSPQSSAASTSPASVRSLEVCEIEVRGYELDSFGHVNHAQYIHYLEFARWKLLQSHGITLEKLKSWQRWPVIAEIRVRYLRPCYMGDILRIETQSFRKGRTSFEAHQTIFLQDEKVMRAVVHIVIVNEKGRPDALPEEWTALLSDAPPPLWEESGRSNVKK